MKRGVSLVSLFRLLGLQRGHEEDDGNLKKFPRGSLEPFGALPTFLGGGPRPPKERFVGPRGLLRRVRSVFENVKKTLVFRAFWAMGRAQGRLGGPRGELLAVQGAKEKDMRT